MNRLRRRHTTLHASLRVRCILGLVKAILAGTYHRQSAHLLSDGQMKPGVVERDTKRAFPRQAERELFASLFRMFNPKLPFEPQAQSVLTAIDTARAIGMS